MVRRDKFVTYELYEKSNSGLASRIVGGEAAFIGPGYRSHDLALTLQMVELRSLSRRLAEIIRHFEDVLKRSVALPPSLQIGQPSNLALRSNITISANQYSCHI